MYKIVVQSTPENGLAITREQVIRMPLISEIWRRFKYLIGHQHMPNIDPSLQKLRLYSTAYSNEYQTFVQIKRVIENDKRTMVSVRPAGSDSEVLCRVSDLNSFVL